MSTININERKLKSGRQNKSSQRSDDHRGHEDQVSRNLLWEFVVRTDKRTSLTVKMVVLTVILGVLTWVIFDQMKTRQLEDLFRSQLNDWLDKQAMEDRISFDNYVKAHMHSVKLFISQRNFSDYIEERDWMNDKTVEVKRFRRSPKWFPRSSVLRTFMQPRYALLLDSKGELREIYQGRSSDPPPSLLNPSRQLLLKSEEQNFMTRLEGRPYILASKRYFDSEKNVRAILMLASPVDDIFLNTAIRFYASGYLVGLVTHEGDPRILTSSNPVEVPEGTPLKDLRKDYLLTGKEFFDYGSSEEPVNLVSFVSTERVMAMVESVAASERRFRILVLPVFIIFVTVLMLWITRRISMLTGHISDFSESVLGAQPADLQKGDQLYNLEERFDRLTEEVLVARDGIKREAEEKLLLEKKNMEIKQKVKRLGLLQSVTQAVGIGVIKRTDNGLQAVNRQMEYFVEICGDISRFDIPVEGEVEFIIDNDKDGKKVFHISSPETLREDDILLVRDITKEKEQTAALEYMAMHDVLTGLPNRALLMDRLVHAIDVSRRDGNPLALIMMDLDRFKEINDTLGHHTGDVILQDVATRLKESLRESDTIARLGGDEFAVVMPLTEGKDAKKICRNIINSLSAPFIINNHNLYIGTSIGIVLSPEHGDEANTLMKRADVAMYVAKNTQCGISVYKEEHDKHSIENLVLMGDLRCAIDKEDLMLYYQPKLDCLTGTITGVEALVRWPHNEHGFISPETFIPIAEHTGLIMPLTMWVLDTALQQSLKWNINGTGGRIVMSVNLSVRNLLDRKFPLEVEMLLKKWGVMPEFLELEITESAVMEDPEHAMTILSELDELGVKLTIDDFGTGYTSIGYLKKLPVDVIKIDKTFIMHMLDDRNDETIVRSTIDLAHNLGMKVVAEGVESEEILDKLRTMGCDEAQGYHICRPVSEDRFAQWVSERV